MATTPTTCWQTVSSAASGDRISRNVLSKRYEPLFREYLRSRWAGSPLLQEVDDCVQEVFYELCKEGGALDRFRLDRVGSFRVYLYSIVKNVARRQEERFFKSRRHAPLDEILHQLTSDEDSLSVLFDRLWAQTIVKEALGHLVVRARARGEAAQFRLDVLFLRFHHNWPIRDIAESFDLNPATVHKQFAIARREFKRALQDILQERRGVAINMAKELELLVSLIR